MMHLVPDLLAPHLRLVFCGTAPSRRSAAAHAYYANPGNGFWSTLYRVGLTPRLFQPEEYRDLLALGIGLTDLCKEHSGNDDELPADGFRPDLLREKIERYQPRWLAFTSKNAAQIYLGHAVTLGVQPEVIGTTRVYVCCSTSGRARRFWLEEAWTGLVSVV